MFVLRSRSSPESPACLPPCSGRVPHRGLSLCGCRHAFRLAVAILVLGLLPSPGPARVISGDEDSAVGQALNDLFSGVESSLVQVIGYRPTGPWSGFGDGSGMVRLEPSRLTVWASGVVLDERGLILTCAEAAQPGDSIQIRLADSRVIGARFLAQDVERGVSLIRADSCDGLVPVAVDAAIGRDSGSWLAVFHFESGKTHPSIRMATLDTAVPGQPGSTRYLRLEMGDCRGSCGGAVIDCNGRFQGMLVQVLAEKEQGAGSFQTGFAMELLECQRVLVLSSREMGYLCRLLEERSRNPVGFLGVRAEIVGLSEAPDAAHEGFSTGRLIVIHVLPGSPAETAGILPGDHILSIAGRPVADANEITARIAAFKPGETISVGLLRNGAPLAVHPRLGDRSALEWLAREEELNRARESRVRRSIRQLEEQLRVLEQQRSRLR